MVLFEFGEKVVQQEKETCKSEVHSVLLLLSGPTEANVIYKVST